MQPVLLRVGPFVLRSYTALLDLGLLGGAVLVFLEARRRDLELMQMLDAALAAGVGAVLIARVVYVGVHWAYYRDHVRQALRIWGGGLAWHGALGGAVVAVAVYCAARQISLSVTLDVLTPGASLVAVCAWLGCFMAGCAYGMEAYPEQGLLWPLSLDLPDLYGIREPRVAVQLLGASWSAIILAVITLIQRRARREGLIFPVWLALYSIGAFGLGFLRADEVPLVGGWRADQVADLALTASGVTALLIRMVEQRGRWCQT